VPLIYNSKDANDLNLESLLRRVIEKHTKAILAFYQLQIQRSSLRTVFSAPGAISQIIASMSQIQRIIVCFIQLVAQTIFLLFVYISAPKRRSL
jgi:mediator of RNA polymerase II transcription subunit 14